LTRMADNVSFICGAKNRSSKYPPRFDVLIRHG
jgi:hypothetical protein